MTTLSRYARAFVTALRMTIRGQQPPGLRHPELYAWIRQMGVLVAELDTAITQVRLDKKAVTVRLDGRPLTLERVLQIFQYHAAQEFPSLLNTSGGRRFNIGAIHATNMNNRFWLILLREEKQLQQPTVQAALARLAEHLDTIPTNKPAQSG
jgi:hypothetical protein